MNSKILIEMAHSCIEIDEIIRSDISSEEFSERYGCYSDLFDAVFESFTEEDKAEYTSYFKKLKEANGKEKEAKDQRS